MSHTPGPWMVGKKDNPIGYLPIFARTGVTKINCIAKTDAHEVGFGIAQDEMESNARLIAAAPKLLAALRDCVSMLKSLEGTDANCEGAISQQIAEARKVLNDVEVKSC